MAEYFKNKINELKKEADFLAEKVPNMIKHVQNVQRAFDLQKRMFALLEVMRIEIEKTGGSNGS